MASASYPANFRPAAAKASMFADGHVEILCATQDLGTGTYTILTQISADELGIDPSQIRVSIGDSRLPSAPTSGGSCSATSAGSAVQAAARALKMRLLQNATSDESSPLWNLKGGEIVARDGRLTSKSESSKSVAYVDIMRRYRKNVVEVDGGARPGSERGEAAGPGAVGGAEQGARSQNASSRQGFG